MPQTLGTVFLVGAGPGDPGLLTMRGAELLRRADVVLYDFLVNPLLLRLTSSEADVVCLGRHGKGRVMTQDEVNRRMIAAAHAGKNVVRLKGGDPSIFGRLAEEIAALEAEGVPYEIVPGVTTALAASSHGGVRLTHRDSASCVAFVTGQEHSGKTESSLDMASLARFPGTLVFYMGVTSAPEWAAALVEHGKSPDTPVAIVRYCSLPEQQTLRTTLGEVPHVLAPGKIRPPALIVVGDVVATQAEVNWFTSRPLFGKTVVVTRPEHQVDDLTHRLTELGATALVQPAIRIDPVADFEAVDAVIERLHEFDWLVFSSANGVTHFLDRIHARGDDLRQLAGCRLAAIGPGTAAALADYHLRADLVPAEYRAEALSESLIASGEVAGKRFLLLRASRGREVLAERLTAAGADVEQAVVYRSTDVTQPTGEVTEALAAGRVDWITVTSSAIARALVALLGQELGKTKLAAISPLTAGVLADAGYPPNVVADVYTAEGLLAAILNAEACETN